jgi:tetratricopeptide (TPR) repeat protein
VYITRQWFSHGFSISLQECQDAIENLSELCRLMQRLLAEPALNPDFGACVAQLRSCSAAVDDVQSEVSEHGAASFGLRVEHAAVVVLLRSFERLCVTAERDTRLVNSDSDSYNKETRSMSYADATAVVADMKKPHFKMSSALTPFCAFVATGRHILFHGTEPGAALALLFCAGAVVRLMQSLGPDALGPASQTADELLFVLTLAPFCDEESLLTHIAQSQSKRPPHPVGGDLSWMHCLLSDSADFQLHGMLSKFDSKKLLKLFVGEFSDVKKTGRVVLPAPSTPENTLKRCSLLTAGIVMSSVSLHSAFEAVGVVVASVSAGLVSLTGKRSPEQIDRFFSGREDEMRRVCEAVEAVLLNARRTSAPAHVAVVGVPGMGKSLLVSQALLQTQKAHASQVSEVYIMKLRGRGASSVEEDLVVHARSLGSKIEVAADSPPSSALLKLKSYLSRLRFVAFIDDANSDGLQAAAQWIPASSEPHAFLVTSQQPAEELGPFETALGAFEKITLSGFDEATSLQLIKSICERCACIVNQADQLKVVVGRLNCLPLGVRLFGDWCNARYHRDVKTMNTAKKVFMEQARCDAAAAGLPFEEDDIRTAEAKFRDEYYISTGGVCDEPSIAQRMLDDWLTNADTASEQLMGANDMSPRGLVGTVRLALHELARLDGSDARACRQLLSVLALCPSSSTPWTLFLGYRDDSIDGIEVFTSRGGLERCAAVLQRSGLVQVHDGMFSMHQLLQQAVKREVSDGVDAAVKLIDGRVGDKDMDGAKAYREMLPAAYHVVKEVLAISAARGEWYRDVANRIAGLMAWLGGGALEVEIRKTAAENAKANGDKENYHNELEKLARSLRLFGKYLEALDMKEQVLAFLRRELPADHPDIAKAMGNLAVSYRDAGRHAEALDMKEQVLAFRRRVLPADNPDIANAMGSLAVSYRDAGRHAEALGLEEQVLAFLRRELPADHPDIAKAMSNLAVSYRGAGRHVEALDMEEQVLAFWRRVLQADHPDIAIAMGNLAIFYGDAGRHAEALDMGEQVLAFRRRVLPADHPDIADAMGNQAASYRDAGRHAEALDMKEQVLAFRRRVLPADHPDIAKAMGSLAVSYRDAGRHAEALDMKEQVLAFRRRVLPADHPDIANAMGILAVSYRDAGRHAEALDMEEQVLAFRHCSAKQ